MLRTSLRMAHKPKELLEYILDNWDDECEFVENKYDMLYGTERLSYKKELAEIGSFLGYENRKSIYKILYGQTKNVSIDKYIGLLSWAYVLGFEVDENEVGYVISKKRFLGIDNIENNRKKEIEGKLRGYFME
ncbi:hypothetical protein [Romboutsia sp.]|uniref:hypothetical protein n=1 Tax=Romboutsia sp. TaxID=1965302 RepID=UPI003F324163